MRLFFVNDLHLGHIGNHGNGCVNILIGCPRINCNT